MASCGPGRSGSGTRPTGTSDKGGSAQRVADRRDVVREVELPVEQSAGDHFEGEPWAVGAHGLDEGHREPFCGTAELGRYRPGDRIEVGDRADAVLAGGQPGDGSYSSFRHDHHAAGRSWPEGEVRALKIESGRRYQSQRRFSPCT